MKNEKELLELLKSLNCKINPEHVPEKDYPVLIDFLKKEESARSEYRISRLLATCGIPKHQIKTFDQFDWNYNAHFPKQEIMTFRNSSWIEQGANLVLIGDSGLGKSHIVRALCHDAIMKGFSAYCRTAFDFLSRIKKSTSITSRIDYFGSSNIKVLCIDELDYSVHEKEDADILFQIIAKRNELLPTLITTNLPPKQWGAMFSGPVASAILDRLSCKGSFLTCEGRSYRSQIKRK
jgi:DNA replication protein DnaC